MTGDKLRSPRFERALQIGELADGRGRTVEVAGRWIAVFRVGDSYFAIDNACPHMAGPLGAGTLNGYAVTCPLHQWEIDIRTGRSTTNEHVRIDRFDTAIEDGWLVVRL